MRRVNCLDPRLRRRQRRTRSQTQRRPSAPWVADGTAAAEARPCSRGSPTRSAGAGPGRCSSSWSGTRGHGRTRVCVGGRPAPVAERGVSQETVARKRRSTYSRSSGARLAAERGRRREEGRRVGGERTGRRRKRRGGGNPAARVSLTN